MKSNPELPAFMRVDLRFVPPEMHDKIIELLHPIAVAVGLVSVRKSRHGPVDLSCDADSEEVRIVSPGTRQTRLTVIDGGKTVICKGASK